MYKDEILEDHPQDRFNCKPVKVIEYEIEYLPSKEEDINGLEKQIDKYRKSLGLKSIGKLETKEITLDDIPF